MTDSQEMADDVAVVTGGTRGIGRAVALQLAKRGATVIANYHADDEQAADTEAELHEFDTQSVTRQFDVGDFEAVSEAFEEIEAEFGPVTILVNNAGVLDNSLLLRMSPEQWQRVVETNLTGTFNCCKQAVRSMLLNEGGRIVNVSSIAAQHGWAGQTNYAASKAGVIGLTRSLARETGAVSDTKIRVNAVVPGYAETDLKRRMEESYDIDYDRIPHDRTADPEEIADTIRYLVSDDASYVHGDVHRVDGGLLS